MLQRSLSKQSRVWLVVALGTLFLANTMALGLVILKMPLFTIAGQLQQLFPRILVFHVDLSFIVWALSVPTLIWLLHLPTRAHWLDRIATGALLMAGGGLLTALITGRGQPLLSNYIPVLDTPLFLGSLGLFLMASAAIAVTRISLPILWRDTANLPTAAFQLAACALVISALVFAITWFRLSPSTLDRVSAETLFWGVGHSLQSVYLLSMLGGWCYLLRHNGSAIAQMLNGLSSRIALILLTPIIAAPLFISAYWSPEDPHYRQAFSIWMRFFSLPLLSVILVWGWRLLRRKQQPTQWQTLAVCLSMGLFLLGVLAGAMIRGDNLLVPAHYHATTGAVNLIYMALIYDLFRTSAHSGSIRRQLQAYGCGVVLMVTGLALSGLMGIGRKLSGMEQALQAPAEIAAMLLMGCGGAIGLIASFWFVAKALSNSLSTASQPAPCALIKDSKGC